MVDVDYKAYRDLVERQEDREKYLKLQEIREKSLRINKDLRKFLKKGSLEEQIMNLRETVENIFVSVSENPYFFKTRPKGGFMSFISSLAYDGYELNEKHRKKYGIELPGYSEFEARVADIFNIIEPS